MRVEFKLLISAFLVRRSCLAMDIRFHSILVRLFHCRIIVSEKEKYTDIIISRYTRFSYCRAWRVYASLSAWWTRWGNGYAGFCSFGKGK